MPRPLARVQLEADTNLLHILEAVHTDKVPRVIERDGTPLAVVAPAEDYTDSSSRSPGKALQDDIFAFAGVWSGLDADKLIDEIYRARHESPPSPPIER